jgi:hypothetical protein
MSPHDLAAMTAAALADANAHMVNRAELDLLQVGALWSEISKRKLWETWGYASLPLAIEERAPRGYSSIMESVQNYDFFVRGNLLPYLQFVQEWEALGHRKLTLVRQHFTLETPTAIRMALAAGKPIPTPTDRIQEKIAMIKMMTVKEGRAYIQARANTNGTQVEQFVDRHYRWTLDQDQMVQNDIAAIKKRHSGPLTDSSAMAYLVQEHMTACGNRKIQS